IYRPPAHLKALRVIDRRLNSQHTASFVVHLYRVLLDPVPDSQTFHSSLQTASYFAIVATIGSSPQESQHVLTMKLLDGMIDQGGIDSGERRSICEQNVGGVFAFANCPVVRSQDQLALREIGRASCRERVEGGGGVVE